jgi:chemotaxis protein methyltransferase CheR
MNWKTIDMPEIGIVETKNIIRAIKQKYDFDFSQYTLSAFRFALDRSILRHHIKYPELLATRILEDDDFFDEFLFDINFTPVELFRDPDMWNLLRSTIFPLFFETFTKPKIWLPVVFNGQDLFSLLILLKIEFPKKKFTVDISALSEKTITLITIGEILAKQLESGMENFEKVFPNADIYKFFKPNGNEYILDFKLFQEFSCRKQNLFLEPLPESSEMIIFRNNLVSYNQEHQKTILHRLTSTLVKDGYLITGIKENIDDYISLQHNLKLIDKNEKVYRKINQT